MASEKEQGEGTPNVGESGLVPETQEQGRDTEMSELSRSERDKDPYWWRPKIAAVRNRHPSTISQYSVISALSTEATSDCAGTEESSGEGSPWPPVLSPIESRVDSILSEETILEHAESIIIAGPESMP